VSPNLTFEWDWLRQPLNSTFGVKNKETLMLESILLPLIGLVIALVGVFYDAKERPKSILTAALVFLLIVTSVATGWSSWQRNFQSEESARQAIQDKNKLQEILRNISGQVGYVSGKVGKIEVSLNTLAQMFGMRSENTTEKSVAESIKANEAMFRIASDKSGQENRKISVQFFPKDIDKDLIQSTLVATLTSVGFSIKSGIGNASLSKTPTNSIWYGAKVPDDAVKLVALSLARAGINIQGIQPFSKDAEKPSKAYLIQIGSYSAIQKDPFYSVEKIVEMKFPR
jgi:hypothetical protein